MFVEHDALDPVPANAQVAVGVNATVPVGVVAPVALVSVTVAVHEVACPINTGEGVHETVVEVTCFVGTETPRSKVWLLVECVESPL